MITPAPLTNYALAKAETFARNVRQAATKLFLQEELARTIDAEIQQLLSDVHRLQERGGSPIPAIALVGRVGEGKSWLARTFLLPEAKAERAEIRTGQNDTERTQEVLWFGPERPFGLSDRGERFLNVAAPLLVDLGSPYLVGDTPGFSDKDPRAWLLTNTATNSAAIKILVTSVSQLRDGSVEHFVAKMNGAIILPVVKFEPSKERPDTPSDTSQEDVKTEINKWQSYAPACRILAPCYMPEQSISRGGDAEALMRDRLRSALEPALAEPARFRESVEAQIEDHICQARRKIALHLKDFRQRVGDAMDRLETMTQAMPSRVQHELLGEESVLHAAIRQRLRTDWLERTPLLCFPFRTFTGLFALTHGAWDRLFFSAIGSVPSLAVTLFKTVRNIRDARRFATSLDHRLEERLQRILAEEFRPALRNFEAAIEATLPVGAGTSPLRQAQVRCRGLIDIEAAAATILQAAVVRYRATKKTVLGLAILGSGSFFFLISGPVISLYRTYLKAHGHAFGEANSLWTEFPQPSGSMILASLILSFAPAIFLALLAMSWCCSSQRVREIAAAFRNALAQETDDRLRTGTLAIELDEPRLEAARYLLTLASDPRPARE